MKPKPIIFQGWGVRGILADIKTLDPINSTTPFDASTLRLGFDAGLMTDREFGCRLWEGKL